MSSKVTNVDFIRSLMRRSGRNKDEIALFLSELQNIIEEGLSDDESVKIAGLGAFKLQWNEPRMSVNVRTGEPIEIEGHYKLAFTPELSLRNLVNEPLNHLETVELSDEKPNDEDERQEDSQFELPLRKLSEQALELKDILNDIQNTVVSIDEEKEERNYDIAETSEKEKNEIQTSSQANETEDSPHVELQESDVIPEEPSCHEVVSNYNNIVAAEPEDSNVAVSASDMLENLPKNAGNKRIKNIYIIGILVVAVASIVLAVMAMFKPSDIQTANVMPTEESEAHADSGSIVISERETIEEDTIAAVESVDLEEDIVEDDRTPVTVAQVKSSSGIAMFDKERRYIQFSDTVELTSGNRLTWIAFQKFGNKVFWPYIYEANMDQISNPNEVSVGTKLRIPILPAELLDENNTESVKYAKELHDYYAK